MGNNTHDDHRERLRTRFFNAGENFEDHELLELILFYSIPRSNTNDTAHNLINRFGSLQGVFDAEYSALLGVDGVGEKSALYIRIISELLRRYERSRNDTRMILDSPDALYSYLKSLFVGTDSEVTYLLLLDAKKHLLLTAKVGKGDALSNVIDARKISKLTLNNNAAFSILVHNHPNGKAIPSGEDITTTEHIEWLMNNMHTTLIDHFIVAEGKCVPILNKYRTFFGKVRASVPEN